MCLAVPVKVSSVDGCWGIVSAGGVGKRVRVDLVDVKLGDYVLVHAGFAISVLKEKDALETLRILGEL
ncbi:MAG: HypC/HybG/HupF family hydrogenase formation chaperone [Candidatus Altiarchaeota archaeon]